MTELAVRQDTTPNVAQPVSPEPERAMRLVEWAQEARAAHNLATALCKTPFAGSWKGDADGATAAILKGAEVGLTPVTALGAFDNIQGTPAPKAITLRALVQAHGHDLEIVEETDEIAVARYRRHGRGEWRQTDFTIGDAQRMGLVNKDNWKKQPRAMLVARVTSKAARLVASDVILGIGYSAEEVMDESGWDGTTRAPRQVASQQTGAQRMGAMLGAPAPQEGGTEGPPVPGEGDTGGLDMSSPLAKAMFASLKDHGYDDRDNALAYVSWAIGRDVASRTELTEDDARKVLDALNAGAGGEQ